MNCSFMNDAFLKVQPCSLSIHAHKLHLVACPLMIVSFIFMTSSCLSSHEPSTLQSHLHVMFPNTTIILISFWATMFCNPQALIASATSNKYSGWSIPSHISHQTSQQCTQPPFQKWMTQSQLLLLLRLKIAIIMQSTLMQLHNDNNILPHNNGMNQQLCCISFLNFLMANYIIIHIAKFILNLCPMCNQFKNAHMQFLSRIETLLKRNSTILSTLAYFHTVVLLNGLFLHSLF